MTEYWVDHGGSATAPYDTQAKAATSLATILAIPPGAGDIIWCCDNAGAGETTAAALTMASSGTNAGGWIRVIGCNSSGVKDGTRYVIDANDGNYSIVDIAGQDLWWFENIEVKNNDAAAGTVYGFVSSASNTHGCVFINCCAHHCKSNGFDLGNMPSNSICIRCVSYLNGVAGFRPGTNCIVLCCAHDNTTIGFSMLSTPAAIGCVAYDNTTHGFNLTNSSILFNCISNSNTLNGLNKTADTALAFIAAIGCRFTNNDASGSTAGIDFNSDPGLTMCCYFKDNGDAAADDEINDVLVLNVPVAGNTANSNVYDSTDADDGYADQANFDFNLNSDALLRRTAIRIPLT
jgi:hypothetical protein